MSRIPILLPLVVLAGLLVACGKSPPPNDFDPRTDRSTGRPPASSNPTGTGSIGTEHDTSTQTYGTFEATTDTYLCIGLHAQNTYLRDRTREEDLEFERLIDNGKILVVKAGTRVKLLGKKSVTIDGATTMLYRVELVDDPDVHGLVKESDLKPVN